MGYHTGLVYYRPRPAPVIAPRDLRPFILELLETGALSGEGMVSFEFKFGRAIDQDDRPSSWIEPLNEALGTYGSMDWDWTGSFDSVRSLADALADDGRSIYRGTIMLGLATDAVIQSMSRVGSPENDEDFVPDSWAMEFGPIKLEDTGNAAEYHVGWMDVSFSGNGYIYPWTTADVLARIESSPELVRVSALCRRYWPVPPEKASFWVRRMRRTRLGKLWPYADVNLPWDWYWGVQGLV